MLGRQRFLVVRFCICSYLWYHKGGFFKERWKHNAGRTKILIFFKICLSGVIEGDSNLIYNQAITPKIISKNYRKKYLSQKNKSGFLKKTNMENFYSEYYFVFHLKMSYERWIHNAGKTKIFGCKVLYLFVLMIL